MRPVVTASVAVGAIALSVATAVEAFELRLEASPCGSREALIRQVSSRLTRSHPEAWRFDVRIAPRGRRFVGTVDVTTPDGRRTQRVVIGNQCHSVFDAAALVTALTLESGFSALPLASDLPIPARVEPATVKDGWKAAVGLSGSGGLQSSLGKPVGWQASAGLAVWRAGRSRSMISLEYLREQGSVSDGDWRAMLALDAVQLRVAPEVAEFGFGLGFVAALGLDLGRVRGDGRFEGGRESQGFWGAAIGELSLDYRYQYLQMGIGPVAGLVFKRHEFDAGGQSLYQSPRTDLGARLRLTVWAN